ncbi:MAG: hypothetical protein ABJM06_06060 [Gilvibacter sp.]
MSTPNDTVSLQDAETWTAEWRKQNPGNVKAFLIPTDDLTGVLAENPDKVRAYIGIKLNGDGTQEAKLLIVAADRVGSIYEDQLPPQQGDNGNYIFDFTSPCPTDCDPNSSLNS